ASLVRDVHIDRWIRDNIDLEQIDKFWAVYDSTFRAIRIFKKVIQSQSFSLINMPRRLTKRYLKTCLI
ncbi:MAG: hypothetical protein SVR08_06620, partial [Spirochaetota bacterium]|nr:hypothetical protein [Spirochaetota bacterium]